jgi:hypothetical protein
LPPNIFEDLVSLITLRLHENPLKALDENLLKNLISLEVVLFDGNLFETVPDNLFKNNENLTEVKLSAKITKMSNKIFSHLQKLKHLYLVDNFCVSLDIYDHNSSIAFTEEVLTSCSCEVAETKSGLNLEKIFFALGTTLWIIFTISVLRHGRNRELFLSSRDGRFVTFKKGKIDICIHRTYYLTSFLAVKNTFDEYIKNTTIHGLNYIVNEASYLITR